MLALSITESISYTLKLALSTSMGQILQCLILLYLFLSIAVSPSTESTTGRTGLSLELIHRFSPRSPFYPGRNLTKYELNRMLIQQSQSRISWLKKSIISTTTIRPPVLEDQSVFLVGLHVGTAQGSQFYYLLMDTGSSLTWIQCMPCDPCFEQPPPIFDPYSSPSYRFLSCDDPLCASPYTCVDGQCTFRITYADQSLVEGLLSVETFEFHTSDGNFEQIPSLAFGCVHNSDRMDQPINPAGLMGLDASPESFVNQLISHTGGRFSYCMFHPDAAASNYLRFGDDIPNLWDAKITPLTIINGLYYVNLLDISIGDQHLHFSPGYFDYRPGDRSGGCIIDSGSSFTYLIQLAYDIVKSMLADHFDALGLRSVRPPDYMVELDLCYEMPQDGLQSLPSMTFILENADFHVEPRQLYMVDDNSEAFCLAILPDDRTTDIGAYQQLNTRFTYDIINLQLSFAPEDCAQG